MKSVREYWRFLLGTKRTRYLTFFSLFVLLLVLPFTVIVAQQQQQIKQEAAQRRDKPVKVAIPNSCDSPGHIPGTLIVKYKNGIDPDSVTGTAEVKKKIKKHKGKRKKKFETTNAETVEVSQGLEKVAAADLSTDPSVEYVECDAYVYGVFVPNDPDFDKQYAFRNTGQGNGKEGADINLTEAWDKTKGEGIVVAVLDTGIDLNHNDLSSKIVKNKKFSDSDTFDDLFGHGTHVAGIIAAKTDNGLGVAGACPGCRLLNVKVLDDTKKGAQSDVVEGVNWAVQNGAKIINMSLSGDTPLRTLEAAINAAWEKGVITVVAAGNDGKNTPTYPASYKNVIAVGATDNKDKRASFSNYGSDWVDVAAPGDKIYSTSPNKKPKSGQDKNYAYLEGTSMASPMVAATAALIFAKEPDLSASEVRKRIESTTDKVGGNKDWKFGRINVAKALANDVSEPPPDNTNDNTNNQLDPCPTSDPSDDEISDPTDDNTNDNNKDNKQNKKKDNKEKTKKENKKDKKDKNKKDKKKRGNKDKKKNTGKGGKKNEPTPTDKHNKSGKKNDPTPTDKHAKSGKKNPTPTDKKNRHDEKPTETPTPTPKHGGKSGKGSQPVSAQARRNPTKTPTPTDTQNPEDNQNGGCNPDETTGTTLSFIVGLHGIGKGGDNRSPESQGTANPKSTDRDLFVEVYGVDNALEAELDTVVTYNKTSGKFEGTVDTPDLSPGAYVLRISSSTYLWGLVNDGNIVEIIGDQENKMPDTRLIAGDINDDNRLDILDFNELSSCYRAQSEFATSAAAVNIPTPTTDETGFEDESSPTNVPDEPLPVCDEQQALNSDIDDDGKVGGSDLNLFIIELLNPHGD